MALQLTVKNTFLDFSDDGEGAYVSRLRPSRLRTCPSVIITPLDAFDSEEQEERATPICSSSNDDSEEDEAEVEMLFSHVKTLNDFSPHLHAYLRKDKAVAFDLEEEEEERATPLCSSSNDDSEEEAEVEKLFSVKTLNDFSPHRHAHLRNVKAVADSAVEQGMSGNKKHCVCGNAFMPDANYCRMCGKERGQAVCARVEHVRYGRQEQQCACGNIPAPDDSFCRKCGREQRQQCACGNVFMPDAKFCRKCGKARCQSAAPVEHIVGHHHQVMLPRWFPFTSLVASGRDPRTAGQPPSVRQAGLVDPVKMKLSSLVVAPQAVPREDRRPEHSQGADLHASGKCKPCGFFWKSQGCEFGKDCCHCHLCPKGALKARRRRAKGTDRSARAERKAKRAQDA
jgi:hypothetical protein